MTVLAPRPSPAGLEDRADDGGIPELLERAARLRPEVRIDQAPATVGPGTDLPLALEVGGAGAADVRRAVVRYGR
jgi:hypothetical protein